MEGKKRTNEEIVKAYEYCVANASGCDGCPYDDWGCAVHAKDIIEIIHRQKAEIERLTEEKDKYQEKWQTSYTNELNLQKQVDELNKVITSLKYAHLQDECKLADLISTCKRAIELSDEWKAKFKQAVKDTAKEIYAQVLEWLPVNEDYHWFITTLENWLKERYGMEVE